MKNTEEKSNKKLDTERKIVTKANMVKSRVTIQKEVVTGKGNSKSKESDKEKLYKIEVIIDHKMNRCNKVTGLIFKLGGYD